MIAFILLSQIGELKRSRLSLSFRIARVVSFTENVISSHIKKMINN